MSCRLDRVSIAAGAQEDVWAIACCEAERKHTNIIAFLIVDAKCVINPIVIGPSCHQDAAPAINVVAPYGVIPHLCR